MTYAEIRRLTYEELDQSLDLSSFAFQYPLTPEAREIRKAEQKPENTWGYFDEQGRLCAKTTVHPLRMWLGGQSLEIGGVASVATWPEYRRQGLVSQLLCHVLNELKESKVTVALLHPFSIHFYRKFGWELCVELKRYEVRMEQLGRFNMEGSMHRLEQPSEHVELLMQLYTTYSRRYQVALDRDEAWWRSKVLNGDKICSVYKDLDGNNQGYILYQMLDRHLQVQEMVYLTREARDGMLAFLGNHDSMADKVSMNAPVDDRLPFVLSDPRIKQEIWPYFMGRIVDVVQFAASYTFKYVGEKFELCLRIQDNKAPWNEGLFLWSIQADGSGVVQQTDGDADLSCDISTLSGMLLGYKRPIELYEDQLLTGNRLLAEKLEEVVPRATPYLMDFF